MSWLKRPRSRLIIRQALSSITVYQWPSGASKPITVDEHEDEGVPIYPSDIIAGLCRSAFTSEI
jgi:hypothetical protein